MLVEETRRSYLGGSFYFSLMDSWPSWNSPIGESQRETEDRIWSFWIEWFLIDRVINLAKERNMMSPRYIKPGLDVGFKNEKSYFRKMTCGVLEKGKDFVVSALACPYAHRVSLGLEDTRPISIAKMFISYLKLWHSAPIVMKKEALRSSDLHPHKMVSRLCYWFRNTPHSFEHFYHG